jgi:Rod binding domain-containing protein
MSVSSIPGVFTGSLFKGTTALTKQTAAAAGFAQIFTTMLAKQMRTSMVGADNGPMGIGGGATGDIYGSFLDEAMGKALASSKSMGQLTKMINRELSGPGHSKTTAANATNLERDALTSTALMSTGETSGALSPIYTGVTMPTDKRGPILLPPTPSVTAPVLLPPPSEG